MAPSSESIAIVGGGIAGLFCALVLRRRGHDVHLFETSKRLGGRIRTLRLDAANDELAADAWNEENLNFYVEFGPMRLELDKQLLLKGLLDFLGIREKDAKAAPAGAASGAGAGSERGSVPFLVPFPSYCAPGSVHDPAYELKPEEKGKNPLQLMRLAFMRIVTRLALEKGAAGEEEKSGFPTKQADLIGRLQLAAALGEPVDEVFCAWIKELDSRDHWDLQTRATIDGVPLFKLGFWNLLTDYLSHDAIAKLRDQGTFYHLLPENPNAAEWLVWWMIGLSASDRLQGIFGGMECIVDRLRQEIGAEDRLHCGCWVKKLEPEGGRLRLVFEGGSAAGELAGRLYDRVILALPRRAAQELQQQSAPEVFAAEPRMRSLLESTFGFPMTKTFVILKRRWWQENNMANRFATRMPTRELHYWKGSCKEDPQGLIMAYTDRPASSFWANYVPSGPQADAHWENVGKARRGEARRPLEEPQRSLLLKKMARYLTENHVPDVSAEDIVWYGIRDWGRAPFSGANHAWRPERRYWVVMRRLADIRLGEAGEAGHPAIHVCGEAYSDYHGFIEGPLRSAAYVLHRILDQPGEEALSWLAGEIEGLAVDPGYLDGLRHWASSLDQIGKDEEFMK